MFQKQSETTWLQLGLDNRNANNKIQCTRSTNSTANRRIKMWECKTKHNSHKTIGNLREHSWLWSSIFWYTRNYLLCHKLLIQVNKLTAKIHFMTVNFKLNCDYKTVIHSNNVSLILTLRKDAFNTWNGQSKITNNFLTSLLIFLTNSYYFTTNFDFYLICFYNYTVNNWSRFHWPDSLPVAQ